MINSLLEIQVLIEKLKEANSYYVSGTNEQKEKVFNACGFLIEEPAKVENGLKICNNEIVLTNPAGF